ncbi:MAG: 2-hydroxyacid dehydrogenase [Gammaproteobacteria bacterium]
MDIAFFSAQDYEKPFFEEALASSKFSHNITYFKALLDEQTAPLAAGFEGVCCFVQDDINSAVLKQLAQNGVKLIALRCAGFNNIDLDAAEALHLTVVRVPQYSPHAVAEHAVALLLTLNRKLHRAYHRTRESDFSLHGLLGFDLVGKTVGVIGTGNIGMVFAQIMLGFGCKVLAYDIEPNPACEAMNVDYVPLEVLLQQSHIISLHCPLTPDTHHLINDSAIEKMHEGTLLINTSRGAVVDTSAVIEGLKNGRLGGVGLDVYEEEGCLFFKDLSDTIIQDDTFARLQTFPNVLITGHQAFFTKEALSNIARITLENIDNFGNS